MIKAIFWDNDGVLVDTERLDFRATQHVLATVGIPLTTVQYIDLFLVQGTGAWHLAAERGLSPSAIEQLRHERNALYSTLLCQEPLLLAGVREILNALHGLYVMGIVTSSEHDHFALIHQTTGLCRTFISCSRQATIRTASPIQSHTAWLWSAVVVARKSAWSLKIRSAGLGRRRQPDSGAS